MSGLSVNLDLQYVTSLPTDIKLLLGKLMNYATNLQDRTKSLVDELLKAIAENEKNDSDFGDLPASNSDSDDNPPETNRFSADGNPTLCTLVVVPGGLPRAIPVSEIPKIHTER
jgi:hypothetical protein